MLPLFRAGLGGVLGPGTQYMSWIAIDDLVAAIAHALANTALDGPLNAVAPAPVDEPRAHEGARAGARAADRLHGVPALALRLVFGELAGATLLASQRVRPQRLLASRLPLRFPSCRPRCATCSGSHSAGPRAPPPGRDRGETPRPAVLEPQARFGRNPR